MKYLVIISLIAAITVAGCTGQTAAKDKTQIQPTTGKNITIYAISVSSNALFIDTEGTDVLYDAGDWKDSSTVIDYISKFNITNLTLVPSHHHMDHIGGMIGVLDKMDVKNVLDSGLQYTTKIFTQFIEKAKAKNFIVVKRGDIFALDNGVTIEILHPGKTDANGVNSSYYFDDENDNSIVMKLTYYNFSMLFTGDCEKTCENDIIKSGVNLKSDILSVGHHGSRTSTSDSFLNAVSPQAATIGVALDNQYGHPHQETISKLNAKHIPIYRTDLNGNIKINTDGVRYDIIPEK